MLYTIRSSESLQTITSSGRGYVTPSRPTLLLDEGIHLLLYAVVPVGDIHVEGVVAAGLLVGPLPPLVVGLHQAATGLWDHVVHWRRWMAGERGQRDEGVMKGGEVYREKRSQRGDGEGWGGVLGVRERKAG